jgi:hypothetical protein
MQSHFPHDLQLRVSDISFRKAGYKYQSDGNEMANDDDFGQDCEELRRAQK